MYKLWETLEEAKKLKWVELSHSLNNEPLLERNPGRKRGALQSGF